MKEYVRLIKNAFFSLNWYLRLIWIILIISAIITLNGNLFILIAFIFLVPVINMIRYRDLAIAEAEHGRYSDEHLALEAEHIKKLHGKMEDMGKTVYAAHLLRAKKNQHALNVLLSVTMPEISLKNDAKELIKTSLNLPSDGFLYDDYNRGIYYSYLLVALIECGYPEDACEFANKYKTALNVAIKNKVYGGPTCYAVNYVKYIMQDYETALNNLLSSEKYYTDKDDICSCFELAAKCAIKLNNSAAATNIIKKIYDFLPDFDWWLKEYHEKEISEIYNMMNQIRI